jgi:hypothetical protein
MEGRYRTSAVFCSIIECMSTGRKRGLSSDLESSISAMDHEATNTFILALCSILRLLLCLWYNFERGEGYFFGEVGGRAGDEPHSDSRNASCEAPVSSQCISNASKQLQKNPKTANLMIAPRGFLDVPEYVIWVHELKLYESDACGLSTVGRI